VAVAEVEKGDVVTALESFVGDEGVEKLVLGFMGARKEVTERQVTDFLERCGQALFVASLIEMAAEGKFSADWSEEENDFVFGIDLRPGHQRKE
jgi:hypothetical protein